MNIMYTEKYGLWYYITVKENVEIFMIVWNNQLLRTQHRKKEKVLKKDKDVHCNVMTENTYIKEASVDTLDMYVK